MTRSRSVSLFLSAVAFAGALSTATSASADEAACIAATEAELPLRKSGKLHDALAQLAICAAPTCSSEVREECTHRIDEINRAMPTLIFAAKDGMGNDIAAVTVTMDGQPFASSLDGRPVAVDPGSHAFHFVADSFGDAPPVDRTFVLREGESDRHETVTFGQPSSASTSGAAGTNTDSSSRASTWTPRKTLAVSSAGVGLVGLGLGVIFGALAISDKSDEKSNCSASICPNRPQAKEDYDTAKSNATASTVGFLAGAAFVAAGAVLWFTAPDPKPSDSTSAFASPRRLHLAPSFSRDGAGLIFGGAL